MSQFPGGYINPYEEPPLEAQKTSGLAITSLVCSLIVCCPLTTVMGPLFGLLAIIKIGSPPKRRGKGLAWAGILIGILATAGWGWFAYKMYGAFQMVSHAPAEALRAGYSGDLAKFKVSFGSQGLAASDAEAKAFIDQLRSRYGEIVRSELDFEAFAQMQQQNRGQQVLPFRYRLFFTNETVAAELKFDPKNQPRQSDTPVFESIEIIDTTRGNIVFPLSAAPSTPATTPTTRNSPPRP